MNEFQQKTEDNQNQIKPRLNEEQTRNYSNSNERCSYSHFSIQKSISTENVGNNL
jgi:hypothetical protein